MATDLTADPAADLAPDLADELTPDGVLSVTGGSSRIELTDRVRRVLPRLLADHRWPDPQQLPRLLPRYVGAVLAEHPLTRFDRTAKLRIQGAAARYCWEHLPDVGWRLVDLPPAGPDAEDGAPPLFWVGAAGVVADRLYCGIHRRTQPIADTSWAWASEWSPLLPAPVIAVRVLPLADRTLTRLVTGDGVQPLVGSDYDAMGGIWR